MKTATLTVTEDLSQIRLDIFLAQNLEGAVSRTAVQKLIEAGHVQVNGNKGVSKQKLLSGDVVTVELVAQAPLPTVKPQKIALNIFYEDNWLLVVNKPVGMLVHPVRGVSEGTLVNALLYHCQKLSDVNTTDPDEEADLALVRPGIVHRLDRETSGLLVVAKDNRTHVALARQFEAHEVKKKYVALVNGSVEFDEGVIDAPLGKHPVQFGKKAVSFREDSREAMTFYRVIKRFSNKATLIALFPKSGRTHQLRVHMAYLKHPILGDDKYGDVRAFSRLALHAQTLGFIHPKYKCYMEFCSKVPAEFLRYS